jgi:hypothetical protein
MTGYKVGDTVRCIDKSLTATQEYAGIDWDMYKIINDNPVLTISSIIKGDSMGDGKDRLRFEEDDNMWVYLPDDFTFNSKLKYNLSSESNRGT